MNYDIAIIGAGVVGSLIACELSRYNVSVCLLDKNMEPAEETTSANSGIVHAGYDTIPGSLKAKTNVEGNAMMEALCRRLDVPFRRTGSLIVGFGPEDEAVIRQLYAQGLQNGVPDMEIVDAARLQQMEPGISPEATAALYAPSAGIVCPYGLATAALELACINGVDFMRNTPVEGIAPREGGGWTLRLPGGPLACGAVVNAAGVWAGNIARMAGDDSVEIHPRKGEYILYDHSRASLVRHVLFPTPANGSKGILVAPTVDGNLFVGPNATFVSDPQDNATTPEGLAEVLSGAQQMVPAVSMQGAITNFAGLRATPAGKDFIIRQGLPGFFHAAGIESPGLTASPAIARLMVELLEGSGITLAEKTGWAAQRAPLRLFREMDDAEKNAAIRQNPSHGRVVCRCETVTEGDIREAIRRPAGARTVDGVKRRTRAGAGRCQGGFCGPRVLEILADELNCKPEEVTKFGGQSYLLCGKTREGA